MSARSLLAMSAVILLGACSGSDTGKSAVAPSGDSAKPASPALPDWSGVWTPSEGGKAPDKKRILPFMKEADAKQWEKIVDAHAWRTPWSYCEPAAVPAMMTDQPYDFEILFTPGRVTINVNTNETRRIYTDGRPHQDDPDPGYYGDSIGHWEGDTLVIDTIGLYPENNIVIGLQAGGDMHVIERLHLVGPDTLQDDLVITGPPMLKEPYRHSRQFARHRQWRLQENLCVATKNRDTGDKLNLFAPK